MEQPTETATDARESHNSSPGAKSQPHETSLTRGAASGKPFHLKYEIPSEPVAVDPAFAQLAVDDLSAGNHAYTIDAKEKGILGLFLDRENTRPYPTRIPIFPSVLHNAVSRTVEGYIHRTLQQKGTLKDEAIITRAKTNADIIADGCLIMIYLKCRAITVSEDSQNFSPSNLGRPRVGTDHVVPTAIAYAIQQLGIVHAADLPTDDKFIPHFPEDGHRHGVPITRVWNPNAYYEAVEYCKDLGMQFSVVDLKVKRGSAWWLLRPFIKEGIFELQCPLPEVNFTDSMALAYSLFLPSEPGITTETLFNIFSLKKTYGTLMRNPHTGINLSSFEALAEVAEKIWTNV
uniref:Coat protein 2 n=1 Tax=Morus alba cryptic virus 2 TaxID=3077606 RepID=A0AA96HC85_9VIRU|nr:coat protein 2 [Morus alba cryptic virus 2]